MGKLLLRPENYRGHHQKIIRKLFFWKIIWDVINKFGSFAANLYHVYLWKTASCKKKVKKIISPVSYPDFSWAYRYIYVMCAWVELKDHSWNSPPPAPLLKGGGRTFEKLSNMGGDTIFFARKEGSTCKLGVDVEMAGCHFFSYFKIQSYLLCVCVGKVRFPLLLFGSSAFWVSHARFWSKLLFH